MSKTDDEEGLECIGECAWCRWVFGAETQDYRCKYAWCHMTYACSDIQVILHEGC